MGNRRHLPRRVEFMTRSGRNSFVSPMMADSSNGYQSPDEVGKLVDLQNQIILHD
jgi:hypothetical protein